MSRYEFLVFAHIVAAIAWVGAGLFLAALMLRAERAQDRVKAVGYHQDVSAMATTYFIPTSLATFVLGLLLVADGPWTLGQTWIVLGIAGWLISFLLGILYFKPQSERIDAIVTEQGPSAAELEPRMRRVNMVERFQLLVLVAVVLDMVVKPGL